MITSCVSIVIPTYNCGRFLPDAIQSALDQSYQNFEIIVIDDGSTDATSSIVKGFRDSRIRYYYQPNSGLPAVARNAGIRKAHGDYIAFLDADDVWYPNKLEKVMEVFFQHPSVSIVCHNENLRRQEKIERVLTYGPYEPFMFKRFLLRGNSLSTSATVLKKDVINVVGLFDERKDFYCVEDYDLWLRIARSGFIFYFLSEVLGEYRIHDANSSGAFGSGNPIRFYRSQRSVLRHHFLQLEHAGIVDRIRHQRNLADTYWKCGDSLCRLEDYHSAVKHYLIALALYPPGLPRYLSSLFHACRKLQCIQQAFAALLNCYGLVRGKLAKVGEGIKYLLRSRQR